MAEHSLGRVLGAFRERVGGVEPSLLARVRVSSLRIQLVRIGRIAQECQTARPVLWQDIASDTPPLSFCGASIRNQQQG